MSSSKTMLRVLFSFCLVAAMMLPWVPAGVGRIVPSALADSYTPPPVASNIVTNGSFEYPAEPAGGFGEVQNGGVPGWNVCADPYNVGVMEINNNAIAAAEDGNQLAELNSEAPVGICQTLATVPGQTYHFSFYFSPRPGTPLDSNEMTVQWGNLNLTPSPIEVDGSNGLDWQKYSYTVTAASSSTIIKFTDVGIATPPSQTSCDCGDLLDNVQVAQAAPAISPAGNGITTISTDSSWTASGTDTNGASGPASIVSSGTGCLSTSWLPASALPGASWIWDSSCSASPTASATFTKTFNVGNTVPALATLQLAVDNYATVTVNDHPVTTDEPNENTLFFSALRTFDVAGDLTTGTNTISITAYNYDAATCTGGNYTFNCNPAGLLAQLTMENGPFATWAGTQANPLVITGTAAPNAPVGLFGSGNCSGTAIGSTTADSSGNWSISLSSLSEGSNTFSAVASFVNANNTDGTECSSPTTVNIDRTIPTSNATFPNLGSGAAYENAAAWSSGCGVPGVCGTASDNGGSGVAAVYVAIEDGSGQFWNGAAFGSTSVWLHANGTTNWSLSVPLPTDGTYTVASAAIDNAGNAQAILSSSLYGLCDPTRTGGQLPLNGGQLALNGGLCTVEGKVNSTAVSGQLALNGGQLALNGGQLPLNGGQLSLNGGQLPLNGGNCTINESNGSQGQLAINGGTLVSTGGQLSLNGGQLALNGGLLSLNGGQLSLNGGQLPLNGGQLPLNGGNCTFSANVTNTATNTTTTVSGQLALNGGQLAMNGGLLSINGGLLSINGGQLPLNGGLLSINGGQLSLNGGAGGTANLGNVVVDTHPPSASFTVDGQTKDGAANINPGATFHIQFSESMAPGSVNGGTISVSPSAGTPACDTTDVTCQNASFGGLQPATTYTVSVSGATDLAGNPVNTATFHFTTGAAAALSGAAAADDDGDNIPNGWDGTWNGGPGPNFTNQNGQTFNLTSWGFSAEHSDLCLVESYMSGTAADGNPYDQHITQAANQAIVNAFANAPVSNPDGKTGIHLVIFEGPNYSAGLPSGYSGPYFGGQIPMTDPLGNATNGAFDWTASNTPGAPSFDSIRTQNFVPTGLAQFCHYAVIAHTLGGTGSSGASRGIGSSDLVIALGGTQVGQGVGTQDEQQGTVMHELGHNLGLQHGGGDSVNYKPNYLSVMNYLFQFTGIPTASAPDTLDYSRSALPPLNETALNDSAGLGSGAAGYGTKFYCPGSSTSSNPTVVLNASGPINWGCSASGPLSAGTIAADINADGSQTTLNGWNDWANLSYSGGDIGMGSVPPPPVTTTVDISGTSGEDNAVKIESGTTPTFKWAGFFAPLASDTTGTTPNVGKAGRTYPVKFQLMDANGSYVSWLSAVTSIKYTTVSCTTQTGNTIDYSTTSAAGLHYDTSANQYVYNWQTPSAPGCYMLKVNLMGGATKLALFQLS